MGHSGGGGGHSNINRPARGLGRVPAAASCEELRPLGTGGAGWRSASLICGIRGGVCRSGGLSTRPERPAHAPALAGTALLCGGFFCGARLLPGAAGRVVLLRYCSVSRRGWARRFCTPPSSPAPRSGTRAARGWPRASLAGRWALSGAFLTVFVRTALAGLWPGAGHPGRVLGAGGARPCPSASWAVPC